MKIKVTKMEYSKVCALTPPSHHRPIKQSGAMRKLIHTLSKKDLKKVGFTHTESGIDSLNPDEPVLYLMNHSSFIDLEIASALIYPKPYHIVCTSDGFVGKDGLMRRIGCIPTNKFVTDVVLVRDIAHALHNLKSSVLMYPEASYSFDGTTTPLPDTIGKCIKVMNVPVVMISTKGAFHRDPLYNCLQVRDVKISAHMELIIPKEDIAYMTADDIQKIIEKNFTYDHFKWQKENNVKIAESFRADGLNRILYKCPQCLHEGKMKGMGTTLTCGNCGVEYTLNEYGYLECKDSLVPTTHSHKFDFSHIPDWYAWERYEVRKELESGTYSLDIPVKICMMVNTDSIYEVGTGRLSHDTTGFHLTGCDGKLDYVQSPTASYSLYSDYYWYEIGDVICIGNMGVLYYCFPMNSGDVVAKTRLATEELYKLLKAQA